MTESVERWRDAAREILAGVGEQCLPEYDPRAPGGSETGALTEDVVLALIHVESAGNALARRVGSQYCGLLQMGRLAGIDVGFDDDGNRTTRALLGNGEAAIDAFVAYVNRYAARVYSPDSVAVLWKGGPGTARHVLEAVEDGVEFDEAVQRAERGDLDNHPVPNLVEYLRRFRRAHDIYRGKG